MGFSQRTQLKVKEEEEPLQIVRPLKWHKPDFSIPYGKNIAIVGQPMVGKTLAAMLIGYFHSDHKDLIKKGGYTQVLEAMDAGLIPEVEKIMVLETENNLLKSLNSGVEKLLLKDIMHKVEVAPIILPRKEVKLTSKGIITHRRELIEALKTQFDDAVNEIVDSEDENTLFIVDSLSGYKKLLDDKFALLFEVLNKRDNASFEGVDTYRQSYYANRNSWWENLMQVLRGYKGWNIVTFKESEVPEHWLKAGEDPYRIKWISGTEHNLDMVYRIEKYPDGSRKFKILNGRYSPANFDDHEFAYSLNSKLGAMPIINSMCEKLLLGET